MYDMMNRKLEIGDIVASPVGAELQLGRVKSLGKKMVVLEPLVGHSKSISTWQGAKRYYENVLKVDL